MKIYVFERAEPSGSVLIEIPKLKILKWINYVADITFHEEGNYENLIDHYVKSEEDSILVIVNDNSDHGFIKRSYFSTYTLEELRYKDPTTDLLYSYDDLKQAFKDGGSVSEWSDMGIEMEFENFDEWYKSWFNKH